VWEESDASPAAVDGAVLTASGWALALERLASSPGGAPLAGVAQPKGDGDDHGGKSPDSKAPAKAGGRPQAGVKGGAGQARGAGPQAKAGGKPKAKGKAKGMAKGMAKGKGASEPEPAAAVSRAASEAKAEAKPPPRRAATAGRAAYATASSGKSAWG
jgi:hypothetical protein